MKRIVMHHPKLLDEVDFICGTSAGGLLSLMLSAGYQPAECHDIYKFAAPHIFGHNPWRVINPMRAKYSDKAKQELMQHYFGDRCIGHLKKTCAVVAFRLDGRKSSTHSFFNKEGWRPSVFSNMPRAEGLVEPDLDLKVRVHTVHTTHIICTHLYLHIMTCIHMCETRLSHYHILYICLTTYLCVGVGCCHEDLSCPHLLPRI